MSSVFITHHNETIYDISAAADLAGKPLGASRAPGGAVGLYVVGGSILERTPETQFKRNVVAECERQKRKRKQFGVIGRPKQPLPNPKEFLKKRTGKVYTVDPDDVDHEKVQLRRKDPVPKTLCAIYEQMHKLHHKNTNFIRENVRIVLAKQPKEPSRKEYTDVKSNTFRIVPKEPEQVSNKIFAKVPQYLKRMIRMKQAYLESENERRGIEQQKCTYITRDERLVLLEGLKKNWDELQRVYQGLPILTDTIPKKARKKDLESKLQALEKDIVLIERHPFLYVYDDEDNE